MFITVLHELLYMRHTCPSYVPYKTVPEYKLSLLSKKNLNYLCFNSGTLLLSFFKWFIIMSNTTNNMAYLRGDIRLYWKNKMGILNKNKLE